MSNEFGRTYSLNWFNCIAHTRDTGYEHISCDALIYCVIQEAMPGKSVVSEAGTSASWQWMGPGM